MSNPVYHVSEQVYIGYGLTIVVGAIRFLKRQRLYEIV